MKVLRHEHKLDIKTTIILGILAFGVCAHAFMPIFQADDVHAGGSVWVENMVNADDIGRAVYIVGGLSGLIW